MVQVNSVGAVGGLRSGLTVLYCDYKGTYYIVTAYYKQIDIHRCQQGMRITAFGIRIVDGCQVLRNPSARGQPLEYIQSREWVALEWCRTSSKAKRRRKR